MSTGLLARCKYLARSQKYNSQKPVYIFPPNSGIVYAKNMATDRASSRQIQHPNAEASTRHRPLFGRDHQACACQRASRPS